MRQGWLRGKTFSRLKERIRNMKVIKTSIEERA